uniref:Uncharacterized protein n=1 Tax=Siphoviridae sp. ctAjZ17 TaxID=2827797 RepID=A0A8S5SND8_9CAUD|nr:MAG TPA: hypothetical protein [Siphoviridae sp. ctAjZ17]
MYLFVFGLVPTNSFARLWHLANVRKEIYLYPFQQLQFILLHI